MERPKRLVLLATTTALIDLNSTALTIEAVSEIVEIQVPSSIAAATMHAMRFAAAAVARPRKEVVVVVVDLAKDMAGNPGAGPAATPNFSNGEFSLFVLSGSLNVVYQCIE